MIRMVITVAAALLLVSTSAFPLAQRTFVSTTGHDSAACSIAAPCRSFAAAIAQTASGGEVIVLDSGGYGAVGISKDVSIIAPKGMYAGISVLPTSPNATGITVYNSKVILRGLSIRGQGGDTGIHVFGDAVAQIEDCAISNLAVDGVRIGGLVGSPEVSIHTTMIHDNGGHGIYATGAARVDIDRTSSQRNGGNGLLAFNGPTVTVTSSALSANAGNGALAYSNINAETALIVDGSVLSRNGANGLMSVSQVPFGNANVLVHAARNTIASNVLNGIMADGDDHGRLVASENEVFNNIAPFRQMNYAVFFRRGNNTTTLNGNTSRGDFNIADAE